MQHRKGRGERRRVGKTCCEKVRQSYSHRRQLLKRLKGTTSSAVAKALAGQARLQALVKMSRLHYITARQGRKTAVLSEELLLAFAVKRAFWKKFLIIQVASYWREQVLHSGVKWRCFSRLRLSGYAVPSLTRRLMKHGFVV